MKTRVVVTLLVEHDNKILLGQKLPDVGPYPNAWHLPGGGVDLEKETLEDAVKRELKEETGLEAKKLERVEFDEDTESNKHGEPTHYVFLLYKVTPKNTNSTAGDDLNNLQWVEKSKLKNLPLTRPSTKYFKEIGWI